MEGLTFTSFAVAMAIVVLVIVAQIIARMADVANAGWVQ